MTRSPLILTAALAFTVCLTTPAVRAKQPHPTLRLEKNDRIVVIGNTFAERLGMFGYFETLLAARFPDYALTCRNMGWSADEPTLQPRPLNFGDVHSHLSRQKADVIFLCFGMNESFKGNNGLKDFIRDLDGFIAALQTHQYNDKSPPRLVLVGPIPHEKLGRPFPDPTDHNKQLLVYTDAMAKVTADRKISFVDLFRPLRDFMRDGSTGKLTFNGIHLSDYGYWVASQVMMQKLGFDSAPQRIKIDSLLKVASAVGASVQNIEWDREVMSFQVEGGLVPTPLPPVDAPAEPALGGNWPTLVVKNLKQGNYLLRIDGVEVVSADHQEWANGVRIGGGPPQDVATEMRRAIVYRNRQFFDRWRAVNGEYIYGRRAEPFGVVSFPPEMETYDRIIGELDVKINALSRAENFRSYELVKVKR